MYYFTDSEYLHVYYYLSISSALTKTRLKSAHHYNQQAFVFSKHSKLWPGAVTVYVEEN